MIKIPEWLSGSKSEQINESNDELELRETFATHSACVINLYYTTSLPLPSMIKHGSWHEFGHFVQFICFISIHLLLVKFH